LGGGVGDCKKLGKESAKYPIEDRLPSFLFLFFGFLATKLVVFPKAKAKKRYNHKVLMMDNGSMGIRDLVVPPPGVNGRKVVLDRKRS
jgi:hypothetical protein